MRLSRKALAAIGVVAGLGIGGSLIYALKPAGEKAAKDAQAAAAFAAFDLPTTRLSDVQPPTPQKLTTQLSGGFSSPRPPPPPDDEDEEFVDDEAGPRPSVLFQVALMAPPHETASPRRRRRGRIRVDPSLAKRYRSTQATTRTTTILLKKLYLPPRR